MYNSIYGSPFPKINPKVRYKTALERAGFDTKPRNPFNSQRNASTGSLQTSVRSPPMRQRNVSTTPSVPNITYTLSSQNSHPSAKGGSGIYLPPVLDNRGRQSVTSSKNSNITSSSRPSNMSHPISRTSECASQEDPFRFERGLSHHQEQYVPPPHTNETSVNMDSEVIDNSPFNFEKENPANARREQDLSPIEKSFMMLTQNDTASLVNPIGQFDDRSPHDRDQELEREHKEEEEEEKEEAEENSSVKYEEMVPEEDENDVESLNFEPHPELHISFDKPQPLQEDYSEKRQEDEGNKASKVPKINVTRESVTPHLSINTSYNSESTGSKIYLDRNTAGLDASKEPKSPGVSSSSTNVEDLSLEGPNDKRLSTAPSENVETPYMPTNLQVEQLIAQLDDVSLLRNAKLDLTGDLLDVADRKASRFKKSSAYLSGYPNINIPSAPGLTTISQSADKNSSRQSLLADDDGVDDDAPSTSTTNGGTPIFYKFKLPNIQSSNGEGNSSQEIFKPTIPTIEVLQLQHKHSITDLKEETGEKLNNSRASSNIGSKGHSPDGSYHESNSGEFKYPPGEGPCRACGLEVTGKRMFSKKENELSGQWHRECFKCIECGIKFNKHVPCYILLDTPYCQKHYHQENHSICKVCSNFIEGECLENDKVERFHVDCLNCFLCKTAITNDYYIFNGEIPLCGNHDMDALLKEGINDSALGNDKNNTLSRRRTRLINFN
ncbi:Pxl1p [Saccharomyces cerevisiae x Saccharomyces kudriavzevii VIN7]|uniref:Pxl1p n=1 Tax=Saccharomyces cerevisiae x Saccharomyces kudriavzevii (strain VIN7) TaxID=1095631 RepID=H0GXT7_SACCK|nr:Pxl1p [Saccharomyces cerevisiae x Saccharomyces kudriavzevii VIN7]